MRDGNLFVIEGAGDGVGKTTQFEMTRDHLREDGHSTITHHFPSYGTPQGRLVEMYLQGLLGDKESLSPYVINALYALDRKITFEKKLQQPYENGELILLDRYTTSSLIYQSALMEDEEKKKEFIDYVTNLEYKEMALPEPNNVIFLDAPYELIAELRARRASNEGIANDIHEKDQEFMKKVYDSAQFVADYLGFDRVRCDDGWQMRKREDIHEEVYEKIKTKIR